MNIFHAILGMDIKSLFKIDSDVVLHMGKVLMPLIPSTEIHDHIKMASSITKWGVPLELSTLGAMSNPMRGLTARDRSESVPQDREGNTHIGHSRTLLRPT